MTRRGAPLPITGYAALSALGADRDTHLQALAQGRHGLVPPVDLVEFPTAVGAVCADLPELPADLAPWSTRAARMAAQLVEQLEAPLRRARERWRPERIAVLLGTSTGGALATERAYRTWIDEGRLPGDYDFRRQHTFGAVLHVVSRLIGATGPAWMASTACTSSAKPLASAARLIAADVIDAALVGGVDTLCSLTLMGFDALQLVDREPCRPFAAERAGLNIGEGGALLLVERRGEARVLLEGVGESSDAFHFSAPHPEGRGALDAMRAALAQAGLEGHQVDHVNAHGTGTPLNDAAEACALRQVLRDDVPVVSTKSYTGHTLGAAGALECAFAAYALEEGFLPPSLRADPVDETLGLNVLREPMALRPRHVLSNSFAFGGNNVSVLLGAP